MPAGILGAYWRPPRRLVAVALAFATGAVIAGVSFELFKESYRQGGPLRAELAFAAGAVIFVAIDTLLDRVAASSPTGLALLAAVTLGRGAREHRAGRVTDRGRQRRPAGRRVRQQLPGGPGGAVSMRETIDPALR